MATLSIEPGVTVFFERYATLTADGTLIAAGTPTKPIELTGMAEEPGTWDGVTIRGTIAHPNTTSVLEHVLVEYGSTNLRLEYAEITVTDSTLSSAREHGLWAKPGVALEMLRTTSRDNGGRAVWLEDLQTDARFVDLVVTGNGTDAIVMSGGTVNGEVLWENAGVPYVALSEITVSRDSTLTI